MTILTTIPNGASFGDIRATLNDLIARVAALQNSPTPTPSPTPTLAALTLAASTVAENSAANTVVGGILGMQSSGTTLSVIDGAGGRFTRTGTSIAVGSVLPDYEDPAYPSHQVAVVMRETHTASGTYRDTTLTITITNVPEAPELGDIAFGGMPASLTIGTAASGPLTGARTGQAISATGLPAGLTIDGPARTWAWSGSGSAGTSAVTFKGDLADSPNTGRTNQVAVTIAAAVAQHAITAVNADGISALWNADRAAIPAYSTGDTELQPDSAPIYFDVVHKGFSETAQPTTYTDRRTLTRRMRQPYTTAAAATHLLGDGLRVALSHHVLAPTVATLPAGITNGATDEGPRPIASWKDRNRRVVGDTALTQVEAYHWSGRNKKPVAAVLAWFESTDGSKRTAKTALTGPRALTNTGADRFTVIGYEGAVACATWDDGTAIPDGTVLIRQAAVYPWVGIDANIQTTVGGLVDGRGFTPQSFLKHTARANSPVHVCLSTTGTDATVTASGATSGGVQKVSTDIAVARANPFLTLVSAFNALKAATGLTGGFSDGCIINLGAGTFEVTGNPITGTWTTGGEVRVRTDPTLAAYAGVLNLSATTPFRQPYLTYERVRFLKPSTFQLSAATRLSLVDCQVELTNTGALFGSISGGVFINGLEVIGTPTNSTLVSGTTPFMLVRGVKQTGGSIDCFNLTGCAFTGTLFLFSARPQSGAMMTSFANLGITNGSQAMLTINETCENIAIVSYVVQFTSANDGIFFSLSGDGGTANIRHLCQWYGIEAGANARGRRNRGYDENTTALRQFSFWDERSIVQTGADYTKHDWFVGENLGAANPQTHVGGWNVLYKVGSLGVLYSTVNEAGSGPNFGPNGNQNHAFMGMKSLYLKNRANIYDRLDPLFEGGYTKATYWNGSAFVAGSGGVATDYRPTASSPHLNILSSAEEALGIDLLGQPRTRGTLGAFA